MKENKCRRRVGIERKKERKKEKRRIGWKRKITEKRINEACNCGNFFCSTICTLFLLFSEAYLLSPSSPKTIDYKHTDTPLASCST